MYNHSSLLIVATLFVLLVLAIEAGCRIGRRTQNRVSKPFKAQASAIQASLLGVLALLLGFTFSLSLQRFDTRSEAVVNEANAIGTAYLRAQLLPPSVREEAQNLVVNYLNLRVRAGAVSLDKQEKREPLLVKAGYIMALCATCRRRGRRPGQLRSVYSISQ